VSVTGVVIAPNALAIAVAACVALIMALGLIGALVDHHLAQRAFGEADRLREHVRVLEETKRELEETSNRLQTALISADTANRAKSQFLAAMSHELRTPLNAVIGFAELLATEIFGPVGDPRYLGYIQDIRTSGTHLLSLINDILDLSKLDSGDTNLNEEEVGIDDLIEAPLHMVAASAANKSLTLRHIVEAHLPRVLVDRRRVQQVLINLLSNAIKFTPDGGNILLTVRRSGDEIVIAVSDTGIGMSPADIPKAFELFRQIDSHLSRSYEGAGLGLPLARNLIALHGGRLVLESVLNEGTTASVFLPSARVVNSQPAEAAA
jgi:signal transduction histidine kinase